MPKTKSWRELGYVPDSEEEESFDINTPDDLTADKRDAISDHGDPVQVWEIPSGQDNEQVWPIQSVEPLHLTPTNHTLHGRLPWSPSADGSVQTSWAGSPRVVIEVQESPVGRFTYPRRNLRSRQPIQIHPFLLENAKYRQTCQNTGIAPVNTVTIANPDRENERGDDTYAPERDSQDKLNINTKISRKTNINHSSSKARDKSPSSQSQDSIENHLLESSSQPHQGLQTATQHNSANDITASSRSSLSSVSDGELPGWEEVVRPHKKRNIAQPRTPKTYGPLRSEERLQNRLSATKTPNIDRPVSPKGNITVPKKKALSKTFHPPPPLPPLDVNPGANGIISHGLSRTSAGTVNDVIEIYSSPLPISRLDSKNTTQPTSSGQDDSTTASEHSATSDDEDKIERIGKRLKGVLPKSWVKLDIQKQNKNAKSNDVRIERNDRNTSARLGVARPKSAAKLITRDSTASLDIESPTLRRTSRSSPRPGVQVDAHRQQSLQWQLNVEGSEDPGSQMEHDTIDFMGPLSTRKRRTGHSSKKRQLTLADTFEPAPKRSKLNASTEQASQITRTRKRTQQRQPRKSVRQMKLSILDMSDNSDAERNTLPDFIRIARRQASRQPDFARQSPDRKFIRLQTAEDTNEGNVVLRRWRRGKIKQKKLIPKAQLRSKTLHQEASAQVPRVAFSNHQTRHFGFHQTKLNPQLAGQEVPQIPAREGSRRNRPPMNQSAHFRPGQLESVESDFVTRNRRLAFNKTLRNADRDYSKQGSGRRNLGLQVSKYLERHESKQSRVNEHRQAIRVDPQAEQDRPRKVRRRKLETFRVHAERPEFNQSYLIADIAESSEQLTPLESSLIETARLSGFAAAYSINFGITPLPTDPPTHFRPSTFIGSGSLKRALLMDHRDLDITAGESRVTIADNVYWWSIWGEPMATAVRTIFRRALETLQTLSEVSASSGINVIVPTGAETICLWFRTMINANTEYLSFSDPIDRIACVDTFADGLELSTVATAQSLDAVLNRDGATDDLKCDLLRSLCLQVVLTAQLVAIEGPKDSSRVKPLLSRGANFALSTIARRGTAPIRDTLVQMRRTFDRIAGIGSEHVDAETIVTLHHALHATGASFWNAIANSYPTIPFYTKVSEFENFWQNIFTILPLLEIDVTGIARIGKRFEAAAEDWVPIKAILDNLLNSYLSNASNPTSSPNAYIRAILRRCHSLIQGWGWKNCGVIISTIYDFFAKNKLAPLFGEGNGGSPKFLDLLDQTPSLETFPNDSSFNVFLKILAVGLRGMRRTYPPRAVQSVIWRCIPNHGRSHRKEDDLEEVELEAFRNHHNLLCTLFWCSPGDSRGRLLQLVRGLVDHRVSHQVVCQISVRSWANLIRYELSADDGIILLDAFTSWMHEILEQALSQYRLARSEPERECQNATSTQIDMFSRAIQKNIRQNQGPILNTIRNAVMSMRVAMKIASSQSQIVDLLQESGLDKVLSLWDEAICVSAVIDALDVYGHFLDLPNDVKSATSQKRNDESQEYGDWPEEYVSLDFIQSPVFQLLSSFFGSDRNSRENLGVSLIDTWVKLIVKKSNRGETHWSSYLDLYGQSSWSRLSETNKKRKFTSYFYAAVLKLDKSALNDQPDRFLSVWLVSLVEREAMLKFQHQLTTAILNSSENDIVRNLPFSKEANGEYVVTFDQLRSRRLALLSSLLSNMRDSHEHLLIEFPDRASKRKDEYASLLRDMMNAMKKNYMELRHEGTIHGAYVDFVHHVVEFLQQYVSVICPVDRYFTDSVEFPLPRGDPTYVVSKLKGYSTKLHDHGALKKLASFFLVVTERAAVEGQQQNFARQLRSAMDEPERNDTRSLRTVFLRAIFPAHLTVVFTDGCWILARPVLLASIDCFKNMMYKFRISDGHEVASVVDMMTDFLHTLQKTTKPLFEDISLLQRPQVIHALNLVIKSVTSTLPCMDFIRRRTRLGFEAAQSTVFFKSFSLYCAQALLNGEQVLITDISYQTADCPSQFKDIRQFAENSLRESLMSHWFRSGSQWFYHQKGGTRKEVLVELGSFEEEKQSFFRTVEELHRVFRTMESFREG